MDLKTAMRFARVVSVNGDFPVMLVRFRNAASVLADEVERKT